MLLLVIICVITLDSWLLLEFDGSALANARQTFCFCGVLPVMAPSHLSVVETTEFDGTLGCISPE